MRLNGNHIDRLLYNVLPYVTIAGLFMFFTGRKEYVLEVFGLCLVMFWTLDTVCLRFKQPTTLRVLEGEIEINGCVIQENQIFRIRPVTDKRYRWSFETVEIELDGGEKFVVIERPTFIWQINRDSWVISELLRSFPNLEDRVVGRHFK